ncbi:unnamed protein product [Rotaria sp. Silwood2]|nr:unnamed protein product [Rotaria sp. Silwood2]
MECIRYTESKLGDLRQYLIEPRCFESLWRLYFDPLIIKSVLQGDALAHKEALGQTAYRPLSKHEIHVQWTDERKDKYIDGMITKRERVNGLVHEALSACRNKEELVLLLSKIRLIFINVKYVLPTWMSLFRHVMGLQHFDVGVMELLFEPLQNVDMIDCATELNQLILDLFELWPQLKHEDQMFYIRNQIVQLIQNLMLQTTNNPNELVEGLIKRICASTTAKNINGHIGFFLLLNDLLPLFYKSNAIEPIKKIDNDAILYYADDILEKRAKSQSMNEHCNALLTILKYVTMHTHDNYLKYWFDRVLHHQYDEFIFQIIAHSIYPSSTLATYVRRMTDEQINQFLKCIEIPIASEFISVLLTIIEALVKNTQVHIVLFQCDHFRQILQNWLMSEISPSTVIRLVILLLDVASSKYNQHVLEIADFFVGDYASRFFSIDFDDQSPFANIIVFMLSISNDDQAIGSSSSDRAELLLRTFFSYTENKIDNDDNINNSFSSHLLSLSKEIVKQQLRVKFVILLSPFIPELMGLLGQTNRLKYASIKLLGEILELSEKERSSLAENIHDDSINEDSTTLSNNAQQPMQQQEQTSFFSPEAVNKSDVARVQHSDFIDGHQFLNSLEEAEQKSVDKLLRDRLSKQRSNNITISTKEENSNSLVLTDTTRENIFKILEVLNNPIPILLEGNTGVGKSATVMEAAQHAARTLIRYNMSSHITIDDLLGKVMLVFDKETHMTNFQFVQGPFTRAFVNGYWILFDELNLAQDTVLQAIESALDTHRLTIHNTSSAQESIIVHQMHHDFRLFATQNPNTGFFKDKREKLSASFLSRFRPIVFAELSDSECHEIIYSSHISIKKLKNVFNDPKQQSVETGPYAEISIRELLKWVNQLIWQKQNGKWPNDGQERANMLSFSAWCIYGARYRGVGRDLIENILTDNGKGFWGRPALQTINVHIDQRLNGIFLDDVRCSNRVEIRPIDNPEREWSHYFAMADLKTIKFDSNVWTMACNVHNAVHQTLLKDEFIRLHGIYHIDRSWLWQWLTSAARFLERPNEFALHGCKMYINRFRHIQAQNKVRECFTRHFKDFNISNTVSDNALVQPEIPYIFTNRILSTLKQVSFNLNIKQPILVTGPEGCGKSDLLLTLGWLNGQQVYQLNITPETEPSALIGQIIPNETKNKNDPNYGEKLIWQNGCVTRSYIDGQWVLLDNLNTAESSVLERLNPVLEEKPMLILTEKGDVSEQPLHNDYRLVATMTPPDSRYSSLNIDELSPSLYNRFAIVHMKDIDMNSDELLQLAEGLLSDTHDVDPHLAVDLYREIFEFLSKNSLNSSKLTLRNFVRFLDSTYRLHQRFKDTLDFISIIWTAYHVTILNQVKGERIKSQMTQSIETFLHRTRPNCKLNQPPFTDCIRKTDEHILTQSRLNYANAVLGAVACNIPLLLEGPSAVGKTTLIAHLCKNIDNKKMHYISNEQIVKLERVNNTDTTTIQDYLGTFLPVNDGFVFQKGALYRAMENGWWFLADEFNLADPSVMNILFPLLEGKNSIIIPTSGKIITAKPGFHFFATQNDASYANRHQLPISLRNRFVEIQFDEFPEVELSEILRRRNKPDKHKQTNLTDQSAKSLALFYHQLIRTRSRITFRELVKWLRRHELFSRGKEFWPMIGVSLLAGKYPLESYTRQTLINDLNTIWPNAIIPKISQIDVRDIGGGLVRFQENDVFVDVNTTLLSQSIIPISPKTFQRTLVRIALAICAGEPVLLVGPTSYKTLIVETWTRLSNRFDELVKIHLTPESESADLIGEIQPYSFLDLLKRLPFMAEQVVHRFQNLCRSQNSTGILNIDDKIFIDSMVDLIKKDFNEAIDLFEKTYSREEEQRQQKEALHNNFSELRAHAESFMIPLTTDKYADEVQNVIETRTSTPSFQHHCIDYEFPPRIYHYEDSYDNDDDDDETVPKKNTFNTMSYADCQLDDDEYGTCGTVDMQSMVTMNIDDNLTNRSTFKKNSSESDDD